MTPDNNPAILTPRASILRFPLMAVAGFALLAALWYGLLRLGWAMPRLPGPLGSLAAQHGPLVVSGFLGTLISLERAVALAARGGRYRWAYVAPLLSALGALAVLAGLPPVAGRALSTLGAAGLVGLFVVINRLQPDLAHGVMGLGAGLWLVGNLVGLAGLPVARAVPWWAGFFVITIFGERLELGRVLAGRVSRLARQANLVAVGVFVAGLALSLVVFDLGVRLAGLGLVALGLWLLRYDVARRTIRSRGLTRYIAACLLPGYGWLALGGLLWLGYGLQATAGPLYDALLHTIFLGYVMSMIFGHAPVILPAVLRVRFPYQPWLYVPLIALHLSLALRVVGDLAGLIAWRRWGGMINVLAVLLFLGLMALARVDSARQPSPAPAQAGGRP